MSSSMSTSSCSKNPRGLSCEMGAISVRIIRGKVRALKIITLARDQKWMRCSRVTDEALDLDRLRYILAFRSLTCLPPFSASIFCL